MTNYEDLGNVSSAAFLNFVEEAEQSVKIAPDDEKFFIELGKIRNFLIKFTKF